MGGNCQGWDEYSSCIGRKKNKEKLMNNQGGRRELKERLKLRTWVGVAGRERKERE